MIRKALLAAGLTASVIAPTAACSSSPGGYYDTICVDPLSQIRYPDAFCLSGGLYYNHPGYLFYAPYGFSAPGYYGRVTNYNVTYTHVPSHAHVHQGGIPTSGGKAPKLTKGSTVTPKVKTSKQSRPTSGTVRKGGSTKIKNPSPRQRQQAPRRVSPPKSTRR